MHLKIFTRPQMPATGFSFKNNPIHSGDHFAFFLPCLSTSICTQHLAKKGSSQSFNTETRLWKRSQTWLFEDKAMNICYTFKDKGCVDLYFIQLASKNLRTCYFAFIRKNEDKFLRAVLSFPPTFNWPKYLTSTKLVGRDAMVSIFLFAPQDKGQALHFWKANERNGNTFPFQRSAGFKGYWDKKKKNKPSKLSAWWLNKIR